MAKHLAEVRMLRGELRPHNQGRRGLLLPRRRPKSPRGDDGKTQPDEALFPAGQFVARGKEKRPPRVDRRDRNRGERPNKASRGQRATEASVPSWDHVFYCNTIGWCWKDALGR